MKKISVRFRGLINNIKLILRNWKRNKDDDFFDHPYAIL
jgi:hypothetical protein